MGWSISVMAAAAREGDEEICDDVVLRRGVGALGEVGREGKGDGGWKVGTDLAFKLAQAAPQATEAAAGSSGKRPRRWRGAPMRRGRRPGLHLVLRICAAFARAGC